MSLVLNSWAQIISTFISLYLLYIFFRQYFWNDEKGKKYKESAPQYVDYVTLYIQKTISDESVFPTKFGKLDGGTTKSALF